MVRHIQDLRPLSERIEKRSLSRIELAHEIVNKFPKFTISDARVMIDALFDSIADAMVSGKRVEIRGFGSFSTYRKCSRRCFVPSENKSRRVDAMWKVRFTMTKSLRKTLMEKLEQ